MLPDTGNGYGDRLICLSSHYRYKTDHIIRYFDIMTTIMILVYLATWGSLATWPLRIFAWVLQLAMAFCETSWLMVSRLGRLS